MKVGTLLGGAVAVLLLLLIVEELQGQTWTDHWPTGRQGVLVVLDTVCWDKDTLDGDPCDTTREVVIGYIPDTTTAIDSCYWSAQNAPFAGSCSCGALYPGGEDYAYDTWGVNYDPSHQEDTCAVHDDANPCGGPAQPRHLYDVPCWYETDSTDPNHPKLNTGCFTLQFGVTHCQAGKQTEMLQFDFANFAGACFGDSVVILDHSDPLNDPDTVAFFRKDSTGAPIGNSRFFLQFASGDEIAPAPPCEPKILSFEICGLWKEGRSPAEHECAAVFEVTFRNTDISTCGIVPFIFGGRCPGLPRIEPIEGDDGPSLSYRMYYDGR